MSNLLDKSSIVLTASAYNNGKVLCVKPSDGSGDFDFSRNSAATRVNAQGLVEDVQILSSNLVQNGSFSQLGSEEVTNGNFSQQGSQLIVNGDFATDSNWILENGAVINNNSVNIIGVGSRFRQDVLTVGKSYKLNYQVVSTNGEAFRFQDGVTAFADINQTVGYHTYYFKASGDRVQFQAIGDIDARIDNCSVVEVGQNWTLGTGWSIGDNKAVSDGAIGSNNLFQSATVVVGKQYKIDITVLDYVSGQVQVSAGAVPRNTMLNNGNFTFYQTASSTTNFFIIAQSFIGSVTNISVKEVGQNWSFNGDYWSIVEGSANFLDVATAGLIQNISFVAGKTYNISFQINSGSASIGFYSSNASTNYIPYAVYEVGTHSVSFNYTTGANLSILGNKFGGTAFTITNIKIIEITDDTNLPRINYEGFSFQDALGSELITNGDFATDSNWNKTNAVIENGKATINVINGAYSNIAQIGVFASGKTYILKATIQGNTGSNNKEIKIQDNGANSGGLTTANGTIVLNESVQSIELKWVSNASSNNLVISRNSGTGNYSFSIDNVSVKEVTGQEVVPDSGCGSWLWEPQSTNLIPYSEDFSNSSWTKTNVSVASNSVTSPDGTINADYLQENTANGTHIIRRTFALNASDYTLSVFAKQGIGSTRQVGLFFNELITGALFNLNDGSVAALVGSPVVKSEEIGNGWFKFSITVTSTAISVNCRIYLGKDGVWTGPWVGDGNSGVYIWGAQLEEQSYSTSYIPTSGQASGVTRNQDVCTNGGTGTGLINSTEGVLYAEIAANSNDLTYRIFSINDGSRNNRVYLQYTNASNTLSAVVKSSNNTQANMALVLSDETNFIKVGFKYKANDFALWVNGVEVATDTSGLSPIGLNNLAFNDGTSNNFFGKTKCLAVWKEALTDTELQELTTI